jgi:hypothetical protein
MPAGGDRVARIVCRADLNCPLLQDDIRRGCTLSGKIAPSFCELYRRPE